MINNVARVENSKGSSQKETKGVSEGFNIEIWKRREYSDYGIHCTSPSKLGTYMCVGRVGSEPESAREKRFSAGTEQETQPWKQCACSACNPCSLPHSFKPVWL